jgi:ParB/RepB/Spo0J family partition protein
MQHETKSSVTGAGVGKKVVIKKAPKETPIIAEQKRGRGRPPKDKPPVETPLLVMLTIDDLVVIPGLNIRTDMGDLVAFAADIKENGIKVPLSGYYDQQLKKYVVVQGHRRHAACTIIGNTIQIPFYLESEGYSDKERIADMISSNSGKPFTFLEEARVYKTLKEAYYMTNVEIAARVGKTSMHVGNSLLLLDAPKELQDYVEQQFVSATLVVENLRQEDGTVVLEGIKKVLEEQEATGKPKKVTAKHIKPKVQVEKPKTLDGLEDDDEPNDKPAKAKPTNTTVISEVIEELQDYKDLASKTAVKTLQWVKEYMEGTLSSEKFYVRMTTDLI